jgi:hypothetical protein
VSGALGGGLGLGLGYIHVGQLPGRSGPCSARCSRMA